MRKYVLLGLVVVALVAMMTSVALAGGYGDWVPGGPNGSSPHTGYSDSTTKCKVCHAVHNASSGAETLLRSTRANACVFCHLNPGTVSSIRPYGQGAGNVTRYTSDVRTTPTSMGWYNHSSTHDGQYAPYVGCTSCHAVHGANTFGGGTYILKNDPGLNNGGALASPVTNQRDFCRDCHNKAGQNIAVGGCFEPGVCHDAGNDTPAQEGNISPEYYTAARNGVTHIMTTTLTGNYNTTVAWAASDQCDTCHGAGSPYAEGNSFPHYTPNAVQFTSTDYSAANTGMDSVCLNCHVQGGDGDNYTTGVGKTF